MSAEVSKEVTPVETKISETEEKPQTTPRDDNGAQKSRKGVFDQIVNFSQKMGKPKKTPELKAKKKKSPKSGSSDEKPVPEAATKDAPTQTETVKDISPEIEKKEDVPAQISTSEQKDELPSEAAVSQIGLNDSNPCSTTPEPHPSIDEDLEKKGETVVISDTKPDVEETQTETIIHDAKIEDNSEKAVEPSVISSDEPSPRSAEIQKDEPSEDKLDVEDADNVEHSDIKTDKPSSEKKEDSTSDSDEKKQEDTLSSKIISESTEDV